MLGMRRGVFCRGAGLAGRLVPAIPGLPVRLYGHILGSCGREDRDAQGGTPRVFGLCGCRMDGCGGLESVGSRGSIPADDDYVYRLTFQPEGRTLDANVVLLGPVDQPRYRVTIHEPSITASTDWSTRRDRADVDGNRVAELDWSRLASGTEVAVEWRVRGTSEAIYGAICLPDLFPVPRAALPRSGRSALGPTDQAQCDDATLSALAEAITGTSPTQLDAVVRMLSWIRRREVEYACSKDLSDPVYRTDALFTMEKKKGNCV